MDIYAPGSKERRAMALMIYTGARGCDARKFGPQMIRDGWIGFAAKQGNCKRLDFIWQLFLQDCQRRVLHRSHQDTLAFG
jgi:hypothetical protein